MCQFRQGEREASRQGVNEGGRDGVTVAGREQAGCGVGGGRMWGRRGHGVG